MGTQMQQLLGLLDEMLYAKDEKEFLEEYHKQKDIQRNLKPNNMKTPMMGLIQNIIDIESKTYNQEQLYMLSALKVAALVLLKEEKEHIIDAFEVGYKSCDLDEAFEINKKYASGEKYYKKTYTKNK